MNIQIQTSTEPQELRILAAALEMLAKEREQAANDSEIAAPNVAQESVSEPEIQVKAEPKKRKPVAKVETVEAVPVEEPAVDAPIAIEVVRAKLNTLSQNGKRTEAIALLGQFGVTKLTDLPAEKYAELLAAAEEL